MQDGYPHKPLAAVMVDVSILPHHAVCRLLGFLDAHIGDIALLIVIK
jgi:hypothetical protein